jgi:ribosome biogenesis GTPase
VRQGVAPERLRNYQKLLREARRDSVTALERKAQVATFKSRTRNARIRMDAKRG